MFRFFRKYIFNNQSSRWLAGVCVSGIAAMAMLALMAVAGWFIVTCAYVGLAGIQTFVYLFPSAIVRGSAIIRTSARYVERVYNHRTMLTQQRLLRVQMFGAASNIPFQQYNNINSANLSARLMADIDTLDLFPLQFMIPAMAISISLILALAYLFLVSPMLALYTLLFFVFTLLFVPFILQNLNRKLITRQFSLQHNINELIQEALEGRMEILHYGMVEKEQKNLQIQSASFYKAEGKSNRNNIIFQAVLTLLFGGWALMIMSIATVHSITGAPVWIAAFFLLISLGDIIEPVWSSISFYPKASQAIKRIKEVMKAGTSEALPAMQAPTLQTFFIRNWQASFNEMFYKTMPVNLSVSKGEWLAISGRTGIGKSTLLHSLAGEIAPITGTIHWNNIPLSSVPNPHQCIFVSQDASLLSGTLNQNLFNKSEAETSKVLDTVELTRWAAQLPDGLNTWIGEHGKTLSGGEKRRLLLAQALLLDPELLLLDEPTAGIDKYLTTAILNKITKRYKGLTVIVATHDQVVLDYCKKQIIMRENAL